MHMYMLTSISQFQIKCPGMLEILEAEIKTYWIFSKSKGHNSAANYSTGTKLKPDLHILMTHLYTEFQFVTEIMSGN